MIKIAEAQTDGPPQKQGQLLSKEDDEEYDTFDKSSQDDRESQDRAGSTWIAAGSFSCLVTKEADADGGTKCCCGDGDVPRFKIAGGLGEEFEWHCLILVSYGLPVPTVFAMVELEKG